MAERERAPSSVRSTASRGCVTRKLRPLSFSDATVAIDLDPLSLHAIRSVGDDFERCFWLFAPSPLLLNLHAASNNVDVSWLGLQREQHECL